MDLRTSMPLAKGEPPPFVRTVPELPQWSRDGAASLIGKREERTPQFTFLPAERRERTKLEEMPQPFTRTVPESPHFLPDSTRGLGITPDPTSDNLTSQETTTEDTSDVWPDGPGLSCPGSSVVADSISPDGPSSGQSRSHAREAEVEGGTDRIA